MDKRRPSNAAKRSCSSADEDDFTAKRRTVDVSEQSTLSTYGREHTPSYPVSSLYHSSSQGETEFSNGPYFNHSRPSSGNCMGPVESTERDMMERSGLPSYNFPNYDSEEGYPGQCEVLHDVKRNYDMEMPSIPSIPSYSSRPTKRNRFNLSRYQLDEDDELLASIPASDPEEKPNKFKTQRERLMALEQSEQMSGRSGPCFDETCLPLQGRDSSSHESQSQSHDSFMSQRERLRRFSSEQARHVSIPNEWEGETRLQEFVAFGNIEAALRPLGLMMARSALVSDSVTTRSRRRSTSSGPSCCYTSRSNSLTP